jgi:hypothetical protein
MGELVGLCALEKRAILTVILPAHASERATREGAGEQGQDERSARRVIPRPPRGTRVRFETHVEAVTGSRSGRDDICSDPGEESRRGEGGDSDELSESVHAGK